jgi:hypothetical protein
LRDRGKCLCFSHAHFSSFVDHDYGCNNADGTYEFRHESALEYVEFLGQPLNSPMSRRAHAGLGVYGVKLFDFDREVGSEEVPDDKANIDPDVSSEVYDEAMSSRYSTYSNKSVAVFVLDIRSNKTPWKQGSEAYLPDYEGDFLGERQWQWFEAAIRQSRAAVNVIISGVQVHANILPNGNFAEAWSRYPRAQQRLFDALLQDGVQAPIIVSGDVHMTQLLRKDCQRASGNGPRRSLVEMTTSGMTHSWGSLNSPRLSSPKQKPTFRQKYESFVAATAMRVLHSVSHWTDLMLPSSLDSEYHGNEGGLGTKSGLQYSLEKNFGELEFDWESRTVVARTMGEDPHAEPLLMAKWSLDQLSGHEELLGGSLTSQDFIEEAELRHHTVQGEWTCVNYRGRPTFLGQMIGYMMALASFTVLFPFPMLLPSIVALFLFRRGQKRKC